MKSIFILLLALFPMTLAFPADNPANGAAAEQTKKSEAEAKKALQEQARAECAEVSAKMDDLIAQINADLKANLLEAAADKGEQLIQLAEFVGCDGRTRPRMNLDSVYTRTLIPGFASRKLSALNYTLDYYRRCFALLKQEDRPVPFDLQVQWLSYLDTYDLEDGDSLRKQADDALKEYLRNSGFPEKNFKAAFHAMHVRACMFFYRDFNRLADMADIQAGDDREKRLAFYEEFLRPLQTRSWQWQARIRELREQALGDVLLSDLDRALRLANLLGLSFTEKEDLFFRALKTEGISSADSRRIHASIVKLEREGFSRTWIAETPMRFSGHGWVSSPDPLSYARAVESQRVLIDTFDPQESKKGVSDLVPLYLEMLALNFDGQHYNDVRANAAELEKTLPDFKEQWQKYVTGYLAASAYFDEDFETAYRLFRDISPEECRQDREFWKRILEPYARTCCAMEKYDEAYRLLPDVNKYIFPWSNWHRTKYARMFAELEKKCSPETVAEVKKQLAEAGK